MEHTPVPWKTGSGSLCIDPDTDEWPLSSACICRMFDSEFILSGQQQENAEFIVRACNSHDKLLEACKEGLEMSKFAAALSFVVATGNTQEFLDELYRMLDHFQTTVRAAIAKAEGKVAQKESGQP